MSPTGEGRLLMAKRHALGIDFGGTKLLAAVVDLDSGEVVATAKKRTSAADSPQTIMDKIQGAAEDAMQSAKMKPKELVGIGVGAAGQVDADKGVLLGTPNLSQAVIDLPIAESLRKRFGVPATLRNDVQVAATGSWRSALDKGWRTFSAASLAREVGGAVVTGGKLVTGVSGSAGEIGHLVVDSGGRLCGCGGRGHVEAYASRTAITYSLMGDLKRGRKSVLRDLAPELSTAAMWPESGAVRSGCWPTRSRWVTSWCGRRSSTPAGISATGLPPSSAC